MFVIAPLFLLLFVVSVLLPVVAAVFLAVRLNSRR